MIRTIGRLSRNVWHQYTVFALLIQAPLTGALYAGFERSPLPPAAAGRGGACAATEGTAMFWRNPASVTGMTAVLLSAVPSPYGLPPLSGASASVQSKLWETATAVGISSVGSSMYREVQGAWSAARGVTDRVTAGVSLRVYHVSVRRYGSASALGVDAGVRIDAGGGVSLGAALTNLGGARLAGGDELPRMVTGGAAYSPAEGALIAADIVHETDRPAFIRAGAEVRLAGAFVVRGGYDGSSGELCGGAGFTAGPVTVDYAVTSHQDLGLSHAVGVTVLL
ncbi:MAG: hypothetical protein F9K22_06320 [Bacteroidetes bacterium]|nr:MAG: hypothetical protein F9K22_06320 [Bacteroidota bacterium]